MATVKDVKCDETYYKMLQQLQEADFVLVELNLYLDTHPQDAQALQQYNHFAQIREQLAREFTARFGPLQHFGRDLSRFPFAWPEPPWPWQV
ncbi:MAG TPA: spore coat protein CotJB [Bacilli bacterium]